MKNLLFFLVSVLTTQTVVSQNIENTSVHSLGEDLIVTFDLMPKESIKELYDIKIYSHYKDEIKLIKVKDGNLINVRPANRIQYTISGRENFNNIRGEIDISISAKMTYSPIRFLTPVKGQVEKRGRKLELDWRGGIKNDKYTLELYKANNMFTLVESEVSQNDFSWSIPQKTKPGKGYQLKLVSTIHPEQSGMTAEFRIRRKIPLVLKVAPAIVLVGVAAVMLNNSSGSSEGEADNFPNPPDLPD